MSYDDSYFRLPKRDETIELLKRLPKSMYLDEIIQHLKVHEQILLGHKDAIEGKSYTSKEAKMILKRWVY